MIANVIAQINGTGTNIRGNARPRTATKKNDTNNQAITGNIAIVSRLSCTANGMLPFSNACSPRVVPQPGQ